MNCENALEITKCPTKARDSQHLLFKPLWEGLCHLQIQLIARVQANQLPLPRTFVALGEIIAFWPEREFRHFLLTLVLTFARSMPGRQELSLQNPMLALTVVHSLEWATWSLRLRWEQAAGWNLPRPEAFNPLGSRGVRNDHRAPGTVIQREPDWQSSCRIRSILSSSHPIFPHLSEAGTSRPHFQISELRWIE